MAQLAVRLPRPPRLHIAAYVCVRSRAGAGERQRLVGCASVCIYQRTIHPGVGGIYCGSAVPDRTIVRYFERPGCSTWQEAAGSQGRRGWTVVEGSSARPLFSVPTGTQSWGCKRCDSVMIALLTLPQMFYGSTRRWWRPSRRGSVALSTRSPPPRRAAAPRRCS